MPHHHARACQATEEELPIVDVSPPVFQLLLEHLYTDSSAVPEESALELFAAADRFGVESGCAPSARTGSRGCSLRRTCATC